MIFLATYSWKLSQRSQPNTRLIVDALTNWALLSKSYNETNEILERIADNNCQWLSIRQLQQEE